MRIWLRFFYAAALGLISVAALANGAGDASVSTTTGSVKLRDGHRLAYTARAGYLPMVTDGTREETAHIYFAAYTADRARGARARPITFVFPGGPGDAASLSHDGPRIVVVKDGEAQVTDNPDTFLAFTDLVLVDPVGTGYSRVTKPEYTSLFYGIKQDSDSLVEFVRLYLQRYDPSESQISCQAVATAAFAQFSWPTRRSNVGFRFEAIVTSARGCAILSVIGSDSYYATLIPGFTLVAHTHRKLSPELQADRERAIEESKKWAYATYLPAIARGNTLSGEERQKAIGQMARITGLKAEVIEAHNLRITQEDFTNELLRDEGKSIGFYDTRKTGPAQTGSYDATKDPSLMARGVAYPSLKERYLLNRELGMVSSNIMRPSGAAGQSRRDSRTGWPSNGGSPWSKSRLVRAWKMFFRRLCKS